MRHVLLIVCVVVVAACDRVTGPTVPLDQEFTLAPDETTTIRGSSLTIRFDGVSGDSRCPADALCIQGGDAVVKIHLSASGAPAGDYGLHTGNLQPVLYAGFTIGLVRLTPYPFGSQAIAPADYRATLVVRD